MILLLIGCLIVLVIASALFSGSETALFSLGPTTLRKWRESGTQGQRLAARLLVDHHGTLVAILLGTNFVNNLTAILVNRAARAYELPAAPLVAGIVSTIVVLIFGEITPKTIAYSKAEAIAPRVAPVLGTLLVILRPAIAIIRWISGALLDLFRSGDSARAITVEEYRTFLALGEKAGAFRDHELDVLNGILGLRESRASSAMTPRVEVRTIDVTDDIEVVYKKMRQAKHRRLPVVDGDLDNVVGVLDCSRLPGLDSTGEMKWQGACMDRSLFLPDLASLSQVLQHLRARQAPLALMVDEFGGVSGLVTTEDIIEAILGAELLDEFDQPPPRAIMVAGGHWRLDGRTPLADVVELIPSFDIEGACSNTIAGLVAERLGELPEPGSTWVDDGFETVVYRTRRGRILEVDILRCEVPT